MNNKKIIPVVICGGSGTRLWPLSRESFPKQYLKINKNDKLSFLQKTVTRIQNKQLFYDPIIICNEEHRFIVAEQLREINITSKSIILEPFGKNTAPAITIAAIKTIDKYEDPTILVLPADHLLNDNEKFLEAVKAGSHYSSEGNLVTFGVSPKKAEIGYGYIESKQPLDYEKLNGESIVRFIEKPNKDIAEKLILDKRYSWNSGIFLFKSKSFLKEIKKLKPDLYLHCKKCISNNILDLDFERIEKDSFSKCESISIDNSVMEKTKLGVVIPLSVGWTDVGNWNSLWEICEKDINNNVTSGKIVTKNVTDSYLRSENKLVVGIGLENMVIVQSDDTVLVTKKNKVQEIKYLVEDLVSQNIPEANKSQKGFRPWGNYISLAKGKKWQVKKISVNPNNSLSLQLHHHRSEHWTVVSGIALVEINGEKRLLKTNESVYIPLKTKHRLTNPGEEELTIIEVQSGDYLGEDDIVRFEDKYGRKV